MDIKKAVEGLIQKHNTNNPFTIADALNVVIIYSDMKNTLGFFNKYKRTKFIHLNANLPDNLKTFVCAHELGHALQHPDVNTPFLKAYTLFSSDRVEREANTFAIELLLPDTLIREYNDHSLSQIAAAHDVPQELICLKKYKGGL